MHLIKKTALATAIAGSLMASSAAMAELSMNVGVTNNYMWRGVSQTTEDAAIQGGIDYAHSSGFYVGTWASNIDWTGTPGYEIDGYLGFGKEFAKDWSFDVGYVYYAYPIDSSNVEADFGELYGSVSWKGLTFFQAIQTNMAADAEDADGNDIKNKAYYSELGYTIEYFGDMSTTLKGGYYYGDLIKDGYGKEYMNYYVDVAKSTDYGDISLALIMNDLDEEDLGAGIDDPRIVVSYGVSF